MVLVVLVVILEMVVTVATVDMQLTVETQEREAPVVLAMELAAQVMLEMPSPDPLKMAAPLLKAEMAVLVRLAQIPMRVNPLLRGQVVLVG